MINTTAVSAYARELGLLATMKDGKCQIMDAKGPLAGPFKYDNQVMSWLDGYRSGLGIGLAKGEVKAMEKVGVTHDYYIVHTGNLYHICYGPNKIRLNDPRNPTFSLADAYSVIMTNADTHYMGSKITISLIRNDVGCTVRAEG